MPAPEPKHSFEQLQQKILAKRAEAAAIEKDMDEVGKQMEPTIKLISSLLHSDKVHFLSSQAANPEYSPHRWRDNHWVDHILKPEVENTGRILVEYHCYSGKIVDFMQQEGIPLKHTQGAVVIDPSTPDFVSKLHQALVKEEIRKGLELARPDDPYAPRIQPGDERYKQIERDAKKEADKIFKEHGFANGREI